MKYSNHINFLISPEIVTNGKDVRTVEEYFSIFFFSYNITGVMLSPILNNKSVFQNMHLQAHMKHYCTAEARVRMRPWDVWCVGGQVDCV